MEMTPEDLFHYKYPAGHAYNLVGIENPGTRLIMLDNAIEKQDFINKRADGSLKCNSLA